ncbi:riboflavin kinase [Patescibacteria group bacterium]|nr:riboflavin kinase [Patescibacteria group bacterium]
MTLRGTVVRGKGEGRKIGYPTANITYTATVVPEPGVWAARVHIGFSVHQGATVVGMWQIENGLPSLEVHLLDFDAMIYEKECTVSLVEKIRDLQAFSDTKTLVEQIGKDVAAVKSALSTV